MLNKERAERSFSAEGPTAIGQSTHALFSILESGYPLETGISFKHYAQKYMNHHICTSMPTTLWGVSITDYLKVSFISEVKWNHPYLLP